MEIILSQDSVDQAEAALVFLTSPLATEAATGLFLEHHTKRGTLTTVRKQNGKTVVGLGLGDASTLTMERVRDAVGAAVRAVTAERYASLSVTLPGIHAQSEEVTAIAEGLLLGAYTFDKYKRDKHPLALGKVYLHAAQDLESARIKGQFLARGAILARDLGNEPPNRLRPSVLADFVVQHFASTAAKVEVWDQAQLNDAGMNGILTVGKGSKYPPRLIVIRYAGDETKELVALVGKGITFDTGGISLKSGRDLSDMRLDMAGAAAVVGAIDALVASQARCNVVGIIASAENIPSSSAMLPGEIITYSNGLSVQVGNTDAEGRLVLADALLYAGQLGAAKIVDIATLTGSAASALGKRYAAVFGEDALVADLLDAGDTSGDYLWRMPLVDEYESKLDSVYADMNNIGGTSAGAIIAALFLRRFVPQGTAWAHVDMAGPMESDQTDGYRPKGATGFGARLLTEYVWSTVENR
ncbi:MAG: leucyl aminopeptidase [Firmicutes bacterium]|nr:leucyl aminopeptidase [Bacillota bacterium]